MDPKHEECPCQAAVPHSRVYDLYSNVGRADRHSGFANLVEEEVWVIACRRCGRRWDGAHIVGGGIYGDTIWELREE